LTYISSQQGQPNLAILTPWTPTLSFRHLRIMSIEMLAPSTLDAKLRPSEEDLMNPMHGSGAMGSMDGKHEGTMMASEMLSHPMHADDPHNPMNFPLHRKIFVSFTAWLFAATV